MGYALVKLLTVSFNVHLRQRGYWLLDIDFVIFLRTQHYSDIIYDQHRQEIFL
jgi:hypothetical protein